MTVSFVLKFFEIASCRVQTNINYLDNHPLEWLIISSTTYPPTLGPCIFVSSCMILSGCTMNPYQIRYYYSNLSKKNSWKSFEQNTNMLAGQEHYSVLTISIISTHKMEYRYLCSPHVCWYCSSSVNQCKTTHKDMNIKSIVHLELLSSEVWNTMHIALD